LQRYGPPPSYPQLKIPGLNAPIPEGASFGYHAGGWGKPPVDEYGRPLYGDVFGVQQPEPMFYEEEQVDRSKHWGDLEEEEEEEEEEDEEEEVEPNEEDLEDGMTSVDTLSTYVFKALFLLGCFTETS
jgi:splicing factor 3B subunit 2